MAIGSVLRTLKQAVWLGWKVDTNWADPLVFAIYYMIRPVAGLLVIAAMFIIGSAAFDATQFAFVFIGNSFYIYVVQIMMTMSLLIHEDRAHYEVLKHIYLSPGSLRWYILGRSLNGVLNATISLVLTLGLGLLIFQGIMGIQIPVNWLSINFPVLVVTILVGVLCFIALGFIICGINIMTSKVQFMLSEYVTGILYLFGGVIFLPSLLPPWGQAIANALPVTYFIRAVRFSILGPASSSIQMDLVYLLVTTAATLLVSWLFFRFAMREARRKGLIDRKEEY